MAVKKTATKAAKAPAKKTVAKKAPAKAVSEPAEEGFDIEINANPAMGSIVVEALRSEHFEQAASDMEEFFSMDEVSDEDIQALLCKVFIHGTVAGAAIAADEAQKGFEDVNKLLKKLSKK